MRPLHRAHRGPFAPIPVSAVLGGVGLLMMQPQVIAQPASSSGPVPDRLVHHFDFDERDEGNLEDLPKFWESLRPAGFPHFAEGGFDLRVGHRSAPSFHLDSAGRNVAYVYTGPDTRLRGNTDYRIEAFIRPDQLVYGRACLSAHFVDYDGQPLPESLVRSRYIGGVDERKGWSRVDLYMPAAPPQAYAIALVAWVLQEPMWKTGTVPPHHIPRRDVKGGAWFDDISIYALPFVKLESGAPGQVIGDEDAPTLLVTLADHDDRSLSGAVSILDASGQVLARHHVPVELDPGAPAKSIDVSGLAAGFYTARLDVSSGGVPLAAREMKFVRLGPLYRRTDTPARAFGILLDAAGSDRSIDLHLLRHLAARSVKVPIWPGFADEGEAAVPGRETDRFLHDLVKDGFSLTAVFAGPPTALVPRDGTYGRPLLELLSGEREVWNEYLARVVVPYASVFRWWQLGDDEQPLTPDAARLADSAANLRAAIGAFLSSPRLSVSLAGATQPPLTPLAVEQISVSQDAEVHSKWVGSSLAAYRRGGYEAVSVFLPPPNPELARLPELARWTQRLIELRHASADTVYTAQPWRRQDRINAPVAEPEEFYVVLRTMADVLGTAAPGPRLHPADGVTALAFHDGAESVVALWDAAAPPEGRRHAIQLGRARRMIDVWGNATRLEKDARGRHLVTLSPMPVLVDEVEPWLVELAASLRLTPDVVESGSEVKEHLLQLVYAGSRTVNGDIRLEAPTDWVVSPRVFSFQATPGSPFSQWIRIRYSSSEPAGRKKLLAALSMAGENYVLDVPLSIEFGQSDLEVSALGVREGSDAVFRHLITNRATHPLNLRSSVTVPGHERQYRPILQLQPGATQVVEFRFHGAAELSGREARLMLREMGDGTRVHNLRILIP